MNSRDLALALTAVLTAFVSGVFVGWHQKDRTRQSGMQQLESEL